MLALNAAIDATCTDEYRRDFVAVADEICKLAGRTQKSLGKIEANADVLVQSISEMNESIRGQNEAINLVNQGISQVDKLARQNVKVANGTDAVTAKVDYMAKAIAQDMRKNKF